MAEQPLTEGERWARAELQCLLDAGFSPRAVVHFLAASQRRAGEVRAARPQLARRAWGWMATGAAAWVALALAGVHPFRERLRAGLAWWGVTAVMLDWHLGMVETEDGRPRQLGAADALTLFRCWLVPVALEAPTPVICGAAALTDVLDGRFARSADPTRIGRDLEGLVDSCFAAAALRGARRHELVGRLVVAAELARLGAGFSYALYVYFGRATAPDPVVTRAGRLTTPVRVSGLIASGLRMRRTADVLLAAGAAGSLIAVAAALAREQT
jgi:phosphatidylglycerophosphate synthase